MRLSRAFRLFVTVAVVAVFQLGPPPALAAVTATTIRAPETGPGGALSPAAHTTNPRSNLRSIACPANGSCVIVGDYRDASNNIHGLIETQSGGSWVAGNVPTSGLTNPHATNPQVSLTNVACPAVGSCVAVGTYRDVSDIPHGLIATLSGGAWTASSVPIGNLPAGSTRPLLFEVACPAVGSCVAVGVYADAAFNQQGLIETLSGGTWSALTVPTGALSPAPGALVSVGDVACTAVGACVAVGAYQDASLPPPPNQYPLVGVLSGGTWSFINGPVAAAAVANNFGNLLDVACPATGTCVAVGSYRETPTASNVFAASLSGGTWVATTLPDGPSSNGASESLSRVVCPAVGACVAVGNYRDASNTRQGLIETLAGGSWSSLTSPLPAGAATNPQVSLGDIACVTSATCVAVGDYVETSGAQQGLIATLVGGVWSALKAPFPAPIFPATTPVGVEGFMNVVACPGGPCIATGGYFDAAFNLFGMITSVTLGLPDLVVDKSCTPDVVNPGDTVTCTLLITVSQSDATNVTVSDDLPNGMSFLGFLGSGGFNCTGGDPITCTKASQLVGSPSVITYTARVDAATPLGSSLVNTVTVGSAGGDHDPANNTDAETTSTPACTMDFRNATVAQSITGTAGPDVICGSPFADSINGLGGDDRIDGNGGADYIVGGTGNDGINGGAGNDYIDGQTGTDSAIGGDGTGDYCKAETRATCEA